MIVVGGVGFGGVKLVALLASPKAMAAELPKEQREGLNKEVRLERQKVRREEREQRKLEKEEARLAKEEKRNEERIDAKEEEKERQGWWIFGKREQKTATVEQPVEMEAKAQLQQRRLVRSEIPSIDFRRVSYSRMFCDLNDEQLVAARANGVHHATSKIDLEHSDELVRIENNPLYVIDTLTYSEPYLVPKASLMLDYIGLRFQEILAERSKSMHGYRLMITSVLRSEEDNDRLRRYNCNATENSCHCYGTTIDISYIRYLRDDGEIVNELWLKEALAMALYELRYEGRCYVKYEYRQGCFHITVRDTEYKGSKLATIEQYDLENNEKRLLMHQIKMLMNNGDIEASKTLVEI